MKPARLAVHCDGGYHKIAFFNDDNKRDIFVVHHDISSGVGRRGDTSVEDLSDIRSQLEIGVNNWTINQLAFGNDPNILYVSINESSNMYEIYLDEREVNQLPSMGKAGIKASSMFTDHKGSLYIHSDTQIFKVNDSSNELDSNTTMYAATSSISFHDGTTCIDSHGNIRSLHRKPFCSEYLVSIYAQDGEELRSYGNGLIFYGDNFAISQHDYTVAGEGDCLIFFHPNGQLFKTIKGFGLISCVHVSTNDVLFVADSWNKQILLFTFTYPPSSLYDQCIRKTLLHLDDLNPTALPSNLQHLLKDYCFRVKIEIWSTRELEIAYTEVITDSNAPIRRGRTESRSVISRSKDNSKRFYLKLKLGIECNTLKQMIASRLKRSSDNMELYTIKDSMPSKLPQLGILKQEHKKIAVVFA